MNDNITFNDFFLVLLDLFFIHGLDFVVSFQVCFFEMFEFPLELFELTGDSFIFGGKIFILFLERLISPVIFFSQVPQFGVENTFLFFKIFVIGMILFSLFLEDFEIVVKLLSVKLVKGFHFLVALLEVLNVVLHFFLEAGVDLHTFDPQFLNSPLELLFGLPPVFSKRLLHIDMLFETLIHFCLGLLNVVLSLPLL